MLFRGASCCSFLFWGGLHIIGEFISSSYFQRSLKITSSRTEILLKKITSDTVSVPSGHIKVMQIFINLSPTALSLLKYTQEKQKPFLEFTKTYCSIPEKICIKILSTFQLCRACNVVKVAQS